MSHKANRTIQNARERRLDRRQVFGDRRLRAAAGRVATDETADRFIHLVQAACQVAEPIRDKWGGLYRRFGNKDHDLAVATHEGLYDSYGLSKAEVSIAALFNVVHKRRLRNPPEAGLGLYVVSEHVYYDRDSRRVSVEGILEPKLTTDWEVTPLTATMPATEKDVEFAITRLLDATIPKPDNMITSPL
jgi:hypothetical protein